MAREFVREVYPDICGEYELSAVFNMRELYSIYFEKKDDCLQVTIPYVGFNVGVAVDGQIVDFSFDYPKYKIEYLDEMITHEKAKKKRSHKQTSELQSRGYLVCRLLLEKNNILKV